MKGKDIDKLPSYQSNTKKQTPQQLLDTTKASSQDKKEAEACLNRNHFPALSFEHLCNTWVYLL